MIIQQFILIFLISFCFAQNSNDLTEKEVNENHMEKAFTADCQALEDSGYCTYSVRIRRIGPRNSCTGNARITVNGVGEPYHFDIKPRGPSVITNFNVTRGDKVVLYMEVSDPNGCFYRIYDGPNGNGNVFVGNFDPSFELYNPCTNNCVFEIEATSSWSPDYTITILNNGVNPVLFNGSPVSFPVKKRDVLMFSFIQGGSGNLGLSVNINDISSGSKNTFFTWIEEAFFSPMTFINPCTKSPLPPSPFGGELYPITQEQIELFLKDVSDPSLIWYYTTLNYDYTISEPSNEESDFNLE